MQKKDARKFLTMGNHKLGGKIASWSLPVSKKICGRVCEGCYAEKAQRIYPAVLPSRDRKFDMSAKDSFVGLMSKAIETLSPDYIRIHDAGEFYSQKYVDKWVEIAKKSTDFTFYAYTKRLTDFNFAGLKSLPNVVIIDSLHAGKINYGTVDKLSPGMFLCPDHKGSPERLLQPKDPICGSVCTYCMTKPAEDTGVFFVKH